MKTLSFGLVTLTLALTALVAIAQDNTAPPPTTTAPAVVRQIDVMADRRVKEMSNFLAQQKQFRFNVEITYDAVEPDGQKVQLGRRSIGEVQRPSGLRVESRGDRGFDHLIAFNGKHFLLHDRANKVYSRIEAPNSLGELFDLLFDKYGISAPVADFLLPDSYKALTDAADSGGMLGEAFVAEKACDHVVFSGDVLDWQIWIEKGPNPWPRKFVITYKDVDVRPQFMAVFRQWETGISIDSKAFDTVAPSGATEVKLETYVEADESDDETADDEMKGE